MIGVGAVLWMSAAVGASVASMLKPDAWRIDFRSLVNLIFCLMVVPKTVVYEFLGDVAFLSRDVVSLPATAVGAAVVCVSGFVIAVNAVYWATKEPGERSDFSDARGRSLDGRRVGAPRSVIVAISMLSVGSLVLMELMLEGSHRPFSKVVFGLDHGSSLPYWLYKAAQFAKAGVVIGLMSVVFSADPRRSLRIVVWFTALSVAIYLYAGQRAGIALTLLQLLLVFQMWGQLRPRAVAMGGMLFVGMSVLVVSVRQTPESTSFAYLDHFVRRYFFEIEKLTALLSESGDSFPYSDGATAVLWDTATPVTIAWNLDYFLGSVALGSASAVPPSIVGEILYYGGGMALIPSALLLAMVFRRLERFAAGDHGPFEVRLAAIWGLSTGYLMLLNSDMSGFVLRLALEMGIFLVAIAVFRAFGHPTGAHSAAQI